MCYDVASGLRTLIKYAKHRHDDPEYIKALEKKLEAWIVEIRGHYHVSGFAHPKLLVFTNEKPLEPQAFSWGLIPHWVKDKKTAETIRNQTLNARSETMFEKPSFKNSAKSKRCIIYVDAFYEHHHAHHKTYSYLLSDKKDSPLALAGLWDEWIDKETGEIVNTVSIVTTKANSLMRIIHNNPKLEEARMPVILHKEDQDKWLMPVVNNDDEQKILELCAPIEDGFLHHHTVRKLKGKDAIGDVKEALEEFNYPDLPAIN